MAGESSSKLALLRSLARGFVDTRLVCAIRVSAARRSIRRRARKEPCHGCGRTLMNQRMRTPAQVLFGGWTCNICEHAHAKRRGKMVIPPLLPAE